ncbi:putative CobQ/CobB/MinD/ParA nucleotide binding protein [Actinoplanes missouriensis 431]|uniref:Putative CobQ/CobB/MinD/ParA nucleotide binding protein n=1 Tax=Actinoplanes missouriensis (strain ATCC 14538 / DSM 43046 / CBS 188.64 / JCM 3121 / NBRC 102363 / NCIMB 12654 / NRRL B-3342 / UNCC 431) TaxID=512565 RepID=I0H0G7_ACTM4|nr:cobalamin biosynthesis protein CobQ [Actinoplanes missouriensis]BAL86504.1 putative CobQ/CobB/MinD/ParA nucleotide binding protein [Actinoplanes missouriensis 431]
MSANNGGTPPWVEDTGAVETIFAREGIPEQQPAPDAETTPVEAPEPEPVPAKKSAKAAVPTLDDLLADRPAPPTGPAKVGWRAAVRRASGGVISLGPGPAEMRHRTAVAAVQRSLNGPKTVVVVNPKGGAFKTTTTLLIARTLGIYRGGYVLGWDDNETRGTMGWRANPARHHNTAVDLLRDLDRFADVRSARVGDLDNYVRSQGDAQFDVLASDEDAESSASIDAEAFNSLHRTLSRFYRVMVIDTGNNMRASNWEAAVDAADQLVIVSTVREDTSQSAAWMADSLNSSGRGDLVANAVTVLADPAATADKVLRARLHRHFGQLTREVIDVPYDPALIAGGPIAYDALSPASHAAWLQVTAAVADGL